MSEWQFNTLFVLACGGAVTLLFGEPLGIEVRPEVVTVFGAIMAFVLTQKRNGDKGDEDKDDRSSTEEKEDAP